MENIWHLLQIVAGRRDIFLYDLESKQLVSLPNLNRRDSAQDQPSLSADGRYIAYVSTERGRTDIFVLRSLLAKVRTFNR